ncbi:MAG TPA: dynamin family protein [Vicinamibacteria bacterium]|nr:dynamin family protein [Vicinamibacteria bacterium]
MTLPALDDARRALLEETRRVVAEVEARLDGLGLPEATRKALADSREQVIQPFLLVVVGEFNAGKSAFINALLGASVLEEGVTPTTSRVGTLRHGPELERHARPDGIDETTAPAEILRAVAIVDTPGTNAVLREHEALTRDFLPRADLVLFVTSADRPYTESERAFLEAIRAWGKKVVLVLNKADLLETPADVAKVVAFVAEQAAKTLGHAPEVFPLSARDARRARERGAAAELERSGMPAFEAKVTATLDEAERFRLKLQSPLGVARRALREATDLVGQRLEVLRGDLTALDAIDERIAGQSDELTRDFRFRLSDVENALLDFERRGHAFFDERLRLGRFRELFDRERLRRDFEAEAVAGLPHEVERRVDSIVDWMVEAELKQWQDVMATLAERPAARPGAEGRVDDRFAWDRARLLESVREAAASAVRHYDAPSEARRLAEKVRESVAQAALLQVSALGLGTIVAALASTTVADVTGILAAGALSLIGLFLLPARRQKARRDLAAKVTAVRARLMSALTASFESERDGAAGRLRAAIAPYARFVRGEKHRLDEATAALGPLATLLDDLSRRIDAVGR